MKKLFLIIGLFICLSGFSQTTLQNAIYKFDSTVYIGYDTVSKGDILYIEKDSVTFGYKLNNLITMCKTLYGSSTITFILCQDTPEQSGEPYARIIIRRNDEQQIFNYDNLSALNKITYDSFINQCKTFIP